MSDDEITVLVIGGSANSGAATVRTVAETGGTVGFTYNAADDESAELMSELPGKDHERWQCDVTDTESVSSVIDSAFDSFEWIDGLVYTPGVIDRATIENTSTESWQRHFDVNVSGAFNVLAAAGPRFKDQGSGSIVVLAASDGIARDGDLSAYNASKTALVALVKDAAREFGPHGVRANVVSPGFIRDPDTLSEEQRQELVGQQPYKRVTSPQDVANACLFLCSERARTITGAVLPVDAGLAL